MTEAFLCDAVRTPIGRYAGALAPVRVDDLAAIPLRALLDRNPSLDPSAIDDVILGCANQAGEDNRNLARMAVLLAGLSEAVPGTTVNRLCGSGLDAIALAARGVRAGEQSLLLAGGAESMSRAPFVMGKADGAFSRAMRMEDTTMGWRFVNPRLKASHGVDTMPETAEAVAERYGIARDDQDAFALRSQQRAGAAQRSGRFSREIVAVPVVGRKGAIIEVTADEHPRPDTTLDQLAVLKPVVRAGGTVTAGTHPASTTARRR